MGKLILSKHQMFIFRLATSAFFFMQGVIFATWTNRIADIRTALKLSESDLGSILLALPLGQLITMPISGFLVSKFTSKKCVFVGSILYPMCLLLINSASSMTSLFVALLCFGISANINNIAINTQAVLVEQMYGRQILGTFHGTWSLACIFGGLLTMLLIHFNIGITVHFTITIIYSLLTLAIFGRLLTNASDTRQDPSDNGKTRYLPTPFIIMLGAIAFGSMSCEGTMFDWSVIYFRDVVKLPDSISSIGYIAFMSMMATGRFVSNYFINKFGEINVLRVNGIMITSGMMIAVLFPYVVSAIIGFLMVGLGVSSVVPICYSSTRKSHRIPSGVAIATVCSIGFMGFLMGPPLIGYIAAATSLRMSFATMAVIGLIVTFVAPMLRFRLDEDSK